MGIGKLSFDMSERPKKLIGELLIEDGVLTRENLQEALEFQKRNGGLIGQILISQGYITEENLISALARQLDIPYLPLQSYAINPESVALVDAEFCRKNVALPFDMDEKRIYLAMADPLNTNAVKHVEDIAHRRIHVFLSTSTEIISAIELVQTMSKNKEMKKAG